MTEIVNFDDYKSYLINYYHYSCDEDQYENRANYINRRYSDDYLKNIIDNSKNFIAMLVQKMANEYRTYKENIYNEIQLPISSGSEQWISNGCTGGWPADKLFCIDDIDGDLLISKYIVRKFFGDKFQIELNADELEYYNPDEQAGYEYCIPTFYITGPLTKFNKILAMHDAVYGNEQAKNEKQKQLVLALKQIEDKKQSAK